MVKIPWWITSSIMSLLNVGGMLFFSVERVRIYILIRLVISASQVCPFVSFMTETKIRFPETSFCGLKCHPLKNLSKLEARGEFPVTCSVADNSDIRQENLYLSGLVRKMYRKSQAN